MPPLSVDSTGILNQPLRRHGAARRVPLPLAALFLRGRSDSHPSQRVNGALIEHGPWQEPCDAARIVTVSSRPRLKEALVSDPRKTRQEPSGWAVSGIVFAASILALIGSFQVIAGLVAIFDDEFYVVARNYTFNLDTSAWGWIHLLLGLLLLFTAFGIFSGRTWASITAIVLAIISAIANFFFIPYYPFWSILVIALDVWVIWALTRPGAIER
jgi:hypothetical protein